MSALERALDDGSALAKFAAMVEAQGGDPRFIDDPLLLPQPGAQIDVRADRAGTVAAVDAAEIGRIVLELGGGRRAVTDKIDPAAGVCNLVQRGETVANGDRIMTLCAATEAKASAFADAARAAVAFAEN